MRYSVVSLLLVSILGCYADDLKSIVQGNDKFTVYTYEELVKISSKNNFIFSGLSAEIILSLLANGANGTTREQLLTGLSLPQNIKNINKAYNKITTGLKVNEKLNLRLANKVYVHQNFSIKEQFNDIAVNDYAADVENLNFINTGASANYINRWVEEQTNNKIKNLIDPESLSNETGLLLVNALYFSGQWKNPFPERGTQDRTFHSSPTKSKKIPTMYSKSTAKYAYNKQLKAKFLELGFKDGNISMTFVLPDDIDGLLAVEQNLEQYLATQEMESATVAITLPKFKIESKIDFKTILQSLGVTEIFAKKNDFSYISDTDRLKVDFILQKAFIDIHENGVEAAAATAVGVLHWAPLPLFDFYYEFNADHPFIFILKESNGLILFAGRFTQ
ncbi:antichymotrypsin-2-like [Diabrotica undecimpunctata]|uniref:antichymotrypsin-2-like n=1 Tax=Diabrotica undecimpunctata TaxID=50387 RepID=UPI003B638C97